MEFDQLRAFLAVAEAGGFSRAARVMASTQPTLSRQVKSLERELGRALFDRLGRRVELTSFGRSMLERSRDLLTRADEMMNAGTTDSGRLRGQLRLGAADSVVLEHLPGLLARFGKLYPDVRLHIRTGSSPDILSWVRAGRVDIGLCMLPEAYPGLTLRQLWSDRFVALVPPGHELADKRCTLAAFGESRQLAINPKSLSYQVLTAAFQVEGLPFVHAMDFDTFHTITEFVAAGVGVGIGSRTVAEPFLASRQVARTHLACVDRLTRRLGLVTRATREPSGPLGVFCQEISRGLQSAETALDLPVADPDVP